MLVQCNNDMYFDPGRLDYTPRIQPGVQTENIKIMMLFDFEYHFSSPFQCHSF